MDLASLAALIAATSAFALGVWAAWERRRDKQQADAAASAQQAQQKAHDDRSVAVEEIEVAIRWQNEIIKDLRAANKQLADVHANCIQDISDLREEQSIDRRIIAELRDEIHRLEAKVVELEARP